MKPESCPLEEASACAAAAEQWTEALAAHATECVPCHRASEAARWMKAVAASAEEGRDDSLLSSLPDAGAVWRRAELAGEGYQVEKVRTAVEYGQMGAVAAVSAGLSAWAVWNWYGIELAAGRFLLELWPQVPEATYVYALASLAPAVLILVALALGYPIFAGE